MPSKDYNQKIRHDLGIPLCDDYFLDDPEAILQEEAISQVEQKQHPKTIDSHKKNRRINADVLIIGAGISGMQSALDIADKGYKVVIIDKTATIGGSMVKLIKPFPQTTVQSVPLHRRWLSSPDILTSNSLPMQN